MAKARLNDVVSHWDHLFEGMQVSSKEFYSRVEGALQSRAVPNCSWVRVDISEGGILSAKRTYLRISRKQHVFDICAAPFGNAFFVSWWLCEPPSGCLSILLGIPVINLLTWVAVRPLSYFKIDTALMFQQSVHAAVLEVLDQMTTAQGARSLAPEERKPLMRDFFSGK